MNGIDFPGINAAVMACLQFVLDQIAPGGVARGGEYHMRNPRRRDDHLGSFSINLRTGKWADFATGDKGGDPISLLAYLGGTSQGEAARSSPRRAVPVAQPAPKPELQKLDPTALSIWGETVPAGPIARSYFDG